MNKSDIKIGSYYHLEFTTGWGGNAGAYKITGFLSPDLVAQASSGYDLYTEWFENYGWPNKYKSYIDDDTLIYSAVKIASIDPLFESDDKVMYIPSTLLSFDNSYEMIKGYKIRYNVTSSPRIFKTDKERNEFKTASKKIAVDGIKSTDEFMADDITVETEESMVLTTQSEIDDRNESRDSKKLESSNSLKQANANREMAERRLFLTSLANIESEKNYKAAVDNMNKFLNDLKKAQSNLRNQSEIVGKMGDVLIGVISELMVHDPNIFDGISGLPSNYTAENVYRTIYKNIERELND